MSVECPKCKTDNTSDSKFCKKCATPLPSSKEILVTDTLVTHKEELIREPKINIQRVKDKEKNALILCSITLILISIGLLTYSNIKYYSLEIEHGFAYALGGVAGSSLWIALVSYLIWILILKKKRGAGLLCFSIIIFLGSGYQSYLMLEKNRALKEAVKSSYSMFENILKGEEVKQKDFDRNSYGDMTPFMEFFNSYSLQIQNDFIKMENEINQHGSEYIFIQKNLEELESIRQSQIKLKKIRMIYDKYEIIFKQRVKEAGQKITNLDVPIDLKASILRGFNKTKDYGIETLVEYYNIERSYLLEANNLLEFLQKQHGIYWFEGEQIMFPYQEDADIYNKYVQKMVQLINKERAWQTRVQREGLIMLKKGKESVK